MPEPLCIKNDNGWFAGLSECLELFAVQLQINSAGVGQIKGDTAVGLPLNAVTCDKVIVLGCGPVDSNRQGSALGNFHSYDNTIGAFRRGRLNFFRGRRKRIQPLLVSNRLFRFFSRSG